MISESFSEGSSLSHSLDPRFRVFFVSLYTCLVAILEAFPALIAALTLSLILTGLSRLHFTKVLIKLAAVNSLIFLFWIILPFTWGGEILFYIGSVAVYREGVFLATRITLKSNAIIMAVIALLTTMPIATLGHALNCLKIPSKIVHLFLMSYRYVYVLSDEYGRLVRSARIRGFRPGTNWHTYKTYAYLIGMLFIHASSRAERVQQAMICRGFQGRFYSLQEFSLSRLDWIWAFFMTLAIIAISILEYGSF